VTLNERIGGFDADSNRITARTAADLPALDIAYRAGIVSSGKNLGKLPILDSRGYDEQGIHYIWRSFSERARIDTANGNHNNHVMWALRHRPAAGHGRAGRGGDGGLARHDETCGLSKLLEDRPRKE
jgi:hypothetical protein